MAPAILLAADRPARYNPAIAVRGFAHTPSYTTRTAPMRILLSNDDGYFAPGLEHLAAALAPHAEITVVAPERDRSGASNSLTLDRPLTVRRAPNGFLFVNGTPTDCVHLAVTGLLDELPDMVISGINLGANMGDDTIYSGTVAAATEGYLLGMPSIAISLASKTAAHFETAAQVAVESSSATRGTPRGRGCSTSTCRTSRAADVRGYAGHAPRPPAQGGGRDPRRRIRAARPCTGSARQVPRPMPARAPTSTRSTNGYVSVTPLQIDLTQSRPDARVASTALARAMTSRQETGDGDARRQAGDAARPASA